MPDRPTGGGGSRLSPQTLIVASLASLTAAIVTSTFWQKGTPITAAITPVIVALASELYSRPARRISEYRSRAATRTQRPLARDLQRERERERVGAPPREQHPPIAEPAGAAGPIRVYRAERPPRRRIHPKVVLVTAAIAFAIAIVVLTVPELLFGGAAVSSGSTTFFGGGHSKRHNPTKQNKGTPSQTQTTPQTTAPQTTTTTPAPPAQTTPQTTTPSTAPAPQSTTTPSQTPPGG